MILKTRTFDRVKTGEWNWFDNVESACSYMDKDGNGEAAAFVAVKFKDCEYEIVIQLIDEAYLLNDAGQTIEVLLRHDPADDFADYDIKDMPGKPFAEAVNKAKA